MPRLCAAFMAVEFADGVQHMLVFSPLAGGPQRGLAVTGLDVQHRQRAGAGSRGGQTQILRLLMNSPLRRISARCRVFSSSRIAVQVMLQERLAGLFGEQAISLFLGEAYWRIKRWARASTSS